MRIAVSAFLLMQPSAAVAVSIATFNLPGYSTTCATAIASNGAVAGTATDGSVSPAVSFIYINGHFSFPKPAEPAGFVEFTGINQSLALAGNDIDSGTVATQAFVYQDGKTQMPGIRGGTLVGLSAIADNGTLLGSATFKVGTLAFLLAPKGELTVLDDGSGFMYPTAMDWTLDRVAGQSFGASGAAAWSYYQGKFTTIAAPGATFETVPRAIDTAGVVRGTALGGTEANPDYHGFILKDRTYSRWDVPGSSSTEINGANEAGQFVGCYKDESGLHGFIATP